MTEYRFHGRSSGTKAALTPSVRLQAESHLHGAALALRHFRDLGCDITTPLAHLDLTEANGVKQMVLVEEVLDWLNDPKQAGFVQSEGLAALLA
jgi:hypothetical protein